VLITPRRFEAGVVMPETQPDQPSLIQRAEQLRQGGADHE
jgi:hypothetical protein